MSPTPRVSVVIPTFNRVRWLVEAIDSVLNQSFRDLEIIVADDGSTDGTAQRLEVLEGPIRYIGLEHSGHIAVVRNRGIAAARGELVAFLDDDDVWHPSKLERQVELLDSHGSLGFVYSDLCFLDPDSSTSAPVLTPHQMQTESLFDRLIADCFIHPSTVVIRHRLLYQIGPFDESFSTQGDYDLWLQLAYATEAGCIPEPLVFVRRHEAGHSQQLDTVHYQNAILVLERLRETRSLNYRQRLRSRIAISRLCTHVGLSKLGTGNIAQARRHFIRSLRWNPLQRRAWIALKQSYTAQTG